MKKNNVAQVCPSQHTFPFDNVKVTYKVDTAKLEFY